MATLSNSKAQLRILFSFSERDRAFADWLVHIVVLPPHTSTPNNILFEIAFPLAFKSLAPQKISSGSLLYAFVIVYHYLGYLVASQPFQVQ